MWQGWKRRRICTGLSWIKALWKRPFRKSRRKQKIDIKNNVREVILTNQRWMKLSQWSRAVADFGISSTEYSDSATIMSAYNVLSGFMNCTTGRMDYIRNGLKASKSIPYEKPLYAANSIGLAHHTRRWAMQKDRQELCMAVHFTAFVLKKQQN